MNENSSINLGDIALKVAVAESTNKESDLDYARSLVEDLPDGMDKDLLSAKLDAVQEEVDIKRAREIVLKVESTLVHIDFARASKLVDNLPSSESKLNLAHRLDIIREGIDTASIVLTMTETAESTCDQADLDKARGMLVEMANCNEKADFETRLDVLQAKVNLNEVVKSIDEVEDKATEDKINRAKTLISSLHDGIKQGELLERLNIVIARNALKVVTERTGLDTISKAGSLIDALKDSSEKQELRTKLDKIVKDITDAITNEGDISSNDKSFEQGDTSTDKSSADISNAVDEETSTSIEQGQPNDENSSTSDDISQNNTEVNRHEDSGIRPIGEDAVTPEEATGEIVINSSGMKKPTSTCNDCVVKAKAPSLEIGVRLRNGNNHVYASVSESSLVDTSIIPILNLDNSATIKPTKCYTWQVAKDGVIVNGGSFTIGYTTDKKPVGILVTCAYPIDEVIDLDIRLPVEWDYSSELYVRNRVSGKYAQSLGTVIVESNTISFHGTGANSYLVVNNLADKSNLEELDLSESFASVSWKQDKEEDILQVIKGATTTGWLCITTDWYYLIRNEKNKLVPLSDSWLEEDGQKYYLQKDGVRATGWFKVEEDWYFFSSNGSMFSDTEMNGFKLDKDGKLM